MNVVRTGGVEIAYERVGEGPSLVFVHGAGEDGRVRLQPENSELEPIYAAHVQVIGKVIGVFRAL